MIRNCKSCGQIIPKLSNNCPNCGKISEFSIEEQIIYNECKEIIANFAQLKPESKNVLNATVQFHINFLIKYEKILHQIDVKGALLPYYANKELEEELLKIKLLYYLNLMQQLEKRLRDIDSLDAKITFLAPYKELIFYIRNNVEERTEEVEKYDLLTFFDKQFNTELIIPSVIAPTKQQILEPNENLDNELLNKFTTFLGEKDPEKVKMWLKRVVLS